MLAGRLFIGLLFIYASIDKIFHPVSFSVAFINYNLMPVSFAPLVAIFVPWVELVCGLMLFVGFRQRSASLIISFLLAAFMVGIGLNLLRGAEMDCGCFDFFGIREDLTIWTLIRDIIFLGLTLPSLLREKPFLSVDGVVTVASLRKMR